MKIHGWICSSLAVFSFLATSSALAAPTTQSQWSSGNTWPLSHPSDDDSSQNISRKKARKAANENLSPFAPGTHNLSVEVGQSFLMGNLGDKYSDAIRYQAHYTYGVSDIFGFDSALGYASHSNGQYSMTSFMTGLRTNLSWYDKIVPYAVVGLGFYRPSVDVTPTNSVSAMLFGIHAGPGVSLLVTRDLFFGASLTFHDVFGTTMQTSSGNVALGGTYTDFLIHAGITF